MKNTHIFDTAHYNNYELAKAAAEKAGIGFTYEYRPTCCKCYRFTLTATTPDQDAILTNVILACTAHGDQWKYIRKVTEYIYGVQIASEA